MDIYIAPNLPKKCILMAIRPTSNERQSKVSVKQKPKSIPPYYVGSACIRDEKSVQAYIYIHHSDNVPMRGKNVCSRPKLFPTVIGLVMLQCVRWLYPFRQSKPAYVTAILQYYYQGPTRSRVSQHIGVSSLSDRNTCHCAYRNIAVLQLQCQMIQCPMLSLCVQTCLAEYKSIRISSSLIISSRICLSLCINEHK